MGIIIISDDLPEVTENCSRVIVLKGGRIVHEMDAQHADEQQILAHMM